MTDVFIGVGSNINREENILSGIKTLHEQFGHLRLSPLYSSAAVGFEGDDFLNLVVGFSTVLTVGELSQRLRDIERCHGRANDAPKFSSRSLDLDILLYGETVGEVDGVVLPRAEVLFNAFVLQPLADIAPQSCHPVSGQAYGELWRAMAAQNRQRLEPYHGLDDALARILL
ncbi:2-amino-4-hydroxy-6-hydroxymethyldihydropteridine diphosphokinase [Litorivivens sp.]|uniref:2-amino-4-hydroxy-6- hydroxymethyldihydropteridine diphosphokinase n=2 Tax=Litorivivens sp. TaxID=2020868 RepID=UPI00356AA5B1